MYLKSHEQHYGLVISSSQLISIFDTQSMDTNGEASLARGRAEGVVRAVVGGKLLRIYSQVIFFERPLFFISIATKHEICSHITMRYISLWTSNGNNSILDCRGGHISRAVENKV